MRNTYELSNNTTITFIKDSKFYDTLISFKIFIELEPKINTYTNLLTHLFGDRTEIYNTKKKLNDYLDNLYGSKVSSLTYTCGNYQIIDVSIRHINEKYINEKLTDRLLELVKDIITRPLIDDNTLKEAKENMKNQWYDLLENPGQASLEKAFAASGIENKISLSAYGDIDILDSISVEDMKAFHQEIINKACKKIYICGDTQSVNLGILEFGYSTPIKSALTKTIIKASTIEDSFKGDQTNLVLLYPCEITPQDNLYPAYSVLVSVLGQTPSSLLFQNIREKHSLCYSIYANKDIYAGMFYIATSINRDNIEKTLGLIKDQFSIIKKGNFDIEDSKLFLINMMKGMNQRANRLVAHEVRNDLLNEDTSIETLIQNIELVTKEDVLKVLDFIGEPLVYIYKGVQ